MYIGFAGVGGSGKSTVARATHAKLEQDGYKVAYYSPFFQSGRCIWYKIVWTIYLWRWFDVDLLRYFLFTTSTKFRITKWTWWRVYMSLFFSYYLDQLRRGKVDVLIYDEDMSKWQAQPVASGAVSVEDVCRLYQERIVPVAEAGLVVFVETEAATAHDRYVARDKEQYQPDEYQARVDSWADYQASCQQLVADIDAATAIDTLVLDGKQSVDSNAEAVKQRVIDTFSHPPKR